MTTFEERGNALLREVWADIQRANQRRELEAIKANPDKHRLTRIMTAGRNTGYVYWSAGQRMIGKTRKEKESYCVAKHKNAAGVFLMWRQVDRYKKARGKWGWHEAQRYDFQWFPTKKEAREIAAKKAERRKLETLPTRRRESSPTRPLRRMRCSMLR